MEQSFIPKLKHSFLNTPNSWEKNKNEKTQISLFLSLKYLIVIILRKYINEEKINEVFKMLEKQLFIFRRKVECRNQYIKQWKILDLIHILKSFLIFQKCKYSWWWDELNKMHVCSDYRIRLLLKDI